MREKKQRKGGEDSWKREVHGSTAFASLREGRGETNKRMCDEINKNNKSGGFVVSS